MTKALYTPKICRLLTVVGTNTRTRASRSIFKAVAAFFKGIPPVGMVLGVLLAAGTGCAARKPGHEYPWVAVQDARSIDGVTETTMGIGRTF
jgi:hypothetical protein